MALKKRRPNFKNGRTPKRARLEMKKHEDVQEEGRAHDEHIELEEEEEEESMVFSADKYEISDDEFDDYVSDNELAEDDVLARLHQA